MKSPISLYLFSQMPASVALCGIDFQWTVQPLVDNYDEDEFFYLIHVHTGFKFSSGTKSKIFFRVNGTEGETGERIMDDGIRQVYFQSVT